MVVANWRLIATSKFSSPLEYSYSTWLRSPIIPIGLSLPQNSTQIQARSLLERMKFCNRAGEMRKYSRCDDLSARPHDQIAKAFGKIYFCGAHLSRLRGPHAARRR